MLQHKYISCLKWIGISITSYTFLWSLTLPSLEANEVCQPLNEGKVEPGLACKCGDDLFHSLSYVTKRYSYNLTCIDCPAGYYYEFKIFECRSCSQPNHNCFNHNHVKSECSPCDTTEPPSPSSQASTSETRVMSLPTEQPAANTSYLPTPKASGDAKRSTAEDIEDTNWTEIILYVGGVVFACGVLLGIIVYWWFCIRRARSSPDDQGNDSSVSDHLLSGTEMVELRSFPIA